MNNDIIYAIALVWATMDGKRDRFLADKEGKLDRLDGTYDGYMLEAAHIVSELEDEGWVFEKVK